jgi:hypothetical protein
LATEKLKNQLFFHYKFPQKRNTLLQAQLSEIPHSDTTQFNSNPKGRTPTDE